MSACNAYRGKKDGESNEDYVGRLAQELDDDFIRVGADTVCAFVCEPVVGAALGCVPCLPGYLKAMKVVCRKHGALFILDEIMCGMGRTGTLHAWQQEDVVPDLQTIGKGLGAGFVPLAALLLSEGVVNTLQRGTGAFAHGHTFQGHPVACAAAVEVQRIVAEEKLIENVMKLGPVFEGELRERLGHHPNVGNIRGRGFFWGIELVKDKETKEPFPLDRGVAMGVHDLGLESEFGISLYPATGSADGVRGDHVLLSPPFWIKKDEIVHIVEVTARVLTRFFSQERG